MGHWWRYLHQRSRTTGHWRRYVRHWSRRIDWRNAHQWWNTHTLRHAKRRGKAACRRRTTKWRRTLGRRCTCPHHMWRRDTDVYKRNCRAHGGWRYHLWWPGCSCRHRRRCTSPFRRAAKGSTGRNAGNKRRAAWRAVIVDFAILFLLYWQLFIQ